MNSDTSRKILRRLVQLALIVVAILLCIDVAYLMRGSLELMPTPEQEDTVRTVTLVLAVMLSAVELGLWFAYVRLRGAARSPDPRR